MSYLELFVGEVKKETPVRFVFNGKEYKADSFFKGYYEFVDDLLKGYHGPIPKGDKLKNIFGCNVYLNYDDIPEYTRETKKYVKLNDIYIGRNKTKLGMSYIMKQFSEQMGKNYVYYG